MMSSSGRSAIDSVDITVTLGFAALDRRTMGSPIHYDGE